MAPLPPSVIKISAMFEMSRRQMSEQHVQLLQWSTQIAALPLLSIVELVWVLDITEHYPLDDTLSVFAGDVSQQIQNAVLVTRHIPRQYILLPQYR